MHDEQSARPISGGPIDRSPAPVRVLLANDAELIAEGLAALLGRSPRRIEVVRTEPGAASTAGAPAGSVAPQIVIVDEALSVEQVEALRGDDGRSGSGPAVVVLTDALDLQHLFDALRLGVRGYLLTSMPPDEMVAALERVAAGELVIEPGLAGEAALVAARLAEGFDWPGAHLGLSRRESEVLQEVSGGGSLAQVAEALGVGRETVRTHLRNVYRKLGVHRRADAAAIAWREGIVRT